MPGPWSWALGGADVIGQPRERPDQEQPTCPRPRSARCFKWLIVVTSRARGCRVSQAAAVPFPERTPCQHEARGITRVHGGLDQMAARGLLATEVDTSSARPGGSVAQELIRAGPLGRAPHRGSRQMAPWRAPPGAARGRPGGPGPGGESEPRVGEVRSKSAGSVRMSRASVTCPIPPHITRRVAARPRATRMRLFTPVATN